MEWLLGVIGAVFFLGVLIFVHELGHFLVAKWCGVGVVKFAVGFGPAIIKFRKAETDYQLGCIPLGGFVRMVGDIPDMLTGEQATDEAVREGKVETAPNEELEAAFRDRSRWFIEKPLWKRSAIVFAGPLFNFIFAALTVAVILLVFGQENEQAVIGKFEEGSPALAAGLAVGDRIIEMNGEAIESWIDMAIAIRESEGKSIAMKIERDDTVLDLKVQPKLAQQKIGPEETAEFYAIGVAPQLLTPGPFEALYSGTEWTLRITALTYSGLWSILTREIPAKEGIAGPIKILQVAKQQAEAGFKKFLYFVAFVSVSLAAINLLPIPILDGGHLMFFFLEAVFGPLSMRKKEFAQQLGLLIILLLMVFAIHNDLTGDPIPKPSEPSFEWKDNGDNPRG